MSPFRYLLTALWWAVNLRFLEVVFAHRGLPVSYELGMALDSGLLVVDGLLLLVLLQGSFRTVQLAWSAMLMLAVGLLYREGRPMLGHMALVVLPVLAVLGHERWAAGGLRAFDGKAALRATFVLIAAWVAASVVIRFEASGGELRLVTAVMAGCIAGLPLLAPRASSSGVPATNAPVTPVASATVSSATERAPSVSAVQNSESRDDNGMP